MPIAKQKIMPCLWFDTEGEAAAKHYVSIFKNSKIGRIGRYGKEGKEIHGKEAGSVMTVEFELEGQKFLALNGGPQFKFDEAVSFQVFCDTQAEIDYFWSKLADGGSEGPCGWLKDKFGLSWQVVPTVVPEMLQDEQSEKGRARLEGDHADEEDRHRDARKRPMPPEAAKSFDDHQPQDHQPQEEKAMQVQSYLFFNGRCEEAIEFYKKTLGAKVEMMMRFKESPEASARPVSRTNKIMHSCFRIGDTAVMASDGCAKAQPEFKGFSLTLNAKDEAEAERLFAALADGGQVHQPLIKTFFSPTLRRGRRQVRRQLDGHRRAGGGEGRLSNHDKLQQ